MTYAKYLAFLALFLAWAPAGFALESQRVTTDDLTSSDALDTHDDAVDEAVDGPDDDSGGLGDATRGERPRLEIAGLSPHAGYAYDSDYPIELGGSREGDMESRLAHYFQYVRAASGALLSFRHDGSCCPFDSKLDEDEDGDGDGDEGPGQGGGGGTGFLQVHLLSAPGQRPVRIYVNGYAEGPLYLPRGLVSTTPDNQIDIEAAVEALQVQNHWRSEKLLKPLAEAGDMLAQYRLGRVFSDIRNHEKAYLWFLTAAEQGHIASQFTLYSLYRKGVGVARDEVKAGEWLRRAAADGHAGARVAVALELLRKSAGKGDIAKPESLLRLAAEQGEASAQGVYGLMLVEGRGSRKDLREGLMWLYLASRGGDVNAAEYYDRLSKEQSSRMLSRITFAAEDWRERTAPPPVIELTDLPKIPD